MLSLAGDSRGEGPPGPISNPAVKLTSADDTASVGRWESRSLPAKLTLWSKSFDVLSCYDQSNPLSILALDFVERFFAFVCLSIFCSESMIMASHTAHAALHTAEHLVTRLLHDRFPTLTEFKTRLKSRKCVVTFAYEGDVTQADCATMQEKLHAISAAALPVSATYMERAEAEIRLPNMHQVPADAESIRVVRVGEKDNLADERACIGHHVANTSEIKNPRLPTLRREGAARWRINLVVG